MGRVINLEEARAFCQQLRNNRETIVFTNGLFDILHVGHLDYLERARALGDVLIVGLNSDRSSRALKGPGHPVMSEQDRGRLLAALEVVSAVVVFDSPTANDLLQNLRPDIYVKGGDYAQKSWPEKEIALTVGCRVELIPYLSGYSTTQLINRIMTTFGRDDSTP